MPGRLPDRGGAEAEWARIDRGRRRLIFGGVAFALAVAAGVTVWALLRTSQEASDAGKPPITPALVTGEATPTADATSSVDVTAAVQPSQATSVPIGPQYPRAALVAYRSGGKLFVASEDGSAPKQVTSSATGFFALSPDGVTIALADVEAGKLVLVDVASGRVKAVGSALQETPSWSPDSAWVVYAAPGPQVTRVARDGTGRLALFTGDSPVALSDASGVAGIAADGSVVISSGGSTRTLRTAAPASALGAGPGRLLYAVDAVGPDAKAVLRAVAIDGSSDILLRTASSARRVAVRDILVSPNGACVAFAERGDDGYSRLWCAVADGSLARELSLRRDAYPLRWSADSRRLFYIDGNAFQGEQTSLMSVLADGLGRTRLVDDAGR
jgi:Tol biopolymer transport system component